MTAINIIGVILVFVDLFIFIPLLCYSLSQFHIIRTSDIMKERKHKLVYCMNILSIISIIVFQPFNVFANLSNINILKSEVIGWIMYICHTSFVCSIYALFLCKIWLLYFKQQYHTTLASQTWQKVINSRFNSWFVINKNKWGNDAFILKLMIIPLLVCVAIELILLYLSFHIHSMLIISIIFSIPTFIFYHKLKDFYDVDKIKTEIHYQCIVMVIIFTLYLIEFMAELINAKNHRYINTLLSIVIGDFALFLMSIISSTYPVYLHNSRKTQSTLILQMTTTSTTVTTPKRTINAMLKIISTYRGFQAFMMHLVTEYATETLFFVTELIQIKYEFQMKHQNILKLPKYINKDDEYQIIDFNVELNENLLNKDVELKNTSIIEMMAASSFLFTPEGSIFCRIRLPTGIPRSELLHSHPVSFKNQLYELYLKYIQSDCIHEINISFDARNIIQTYFKEYQKDTEDKQADDKSDFMIFNIMDAACIEVLKLMFISYSRFKQDENVLLNQTLNGNFISSEWNNVAIHRA